MGLVEPLSGPEVRELCRRIIANGEVRFTRHARDRMAERDLVETDVKNVLRGGIPWDVTSEFGTWRYALRTPRINVIIAFRSESALVIITAWRNAP